MLQITDLTFNAWGRKFLEDASVSLPPGSKVGLVGRNGIGKSTALKILADFPDGLDAIITGVGTGGHLTGVAQVLKAKWPQLKVFAVEPSQSPVISGGAPAPHPIQGIGAGFIPKNLHTGLLDGVILVDAEPARDMARRSAREEGMLVGISSGATLAAIAQKLPELPAGAKVLGFNYDTGERYLSIEGFLPTA